MNMIFSARRQFTKHLTRVSGFSLVEMLIVLVLSTLVVSALLYVMVDLVTSDQSEKARSNTNEEMKQALNYMAAELREATYVYTGKELEVSRSVPKKTLSSLKTFLPNFGTNTRAIVAFWKVEPVPYNSIGNLPNSCTGFTGIAAEECEALRVEQRTYTLVVYVQSTENTNGDWKGESRIYRYQLRKYSNPATLTKTTGYIDPMIETTFQQWPYNLNYISAQSVKPVINSSNFVPLVDFVASPIKVVAKEKDVSCPSPTDGYKTSPYGPDPTSGNLYKPTDAESFFVCVHDASNNAVVGFNQDVFVFLRGNTKGKPGEEWKDDKDTMLDILQVQAISRGVVRKTVAD